MAARTEALTAEKDTTTPTHPCVFSEKFTLVMKNLIYKHVDLAYNDLTPTHQDTKMKTYTFEPAADIVVTGHDDEMADYDNPRGEIYGYAAFVIATDEVGNRVRLYVKTGYLACDVLPVAEKLAKALSARFDNLGKLPVAFNTWQETYPAYGSDAYVDDIDDEMAREKAYDLGEF